MWTDSRTHPAAKYQQIHIGLAAQMGELAASVASVVRGPPLSSILPSSQTALDPPSAELRPSKPPRASNSNAIDALQAALNGNALTRPKESTSEHTTPPHTPPQLQAGRSVGGPAWGATEARIPPQHQFAQFVLLGFNNYFIQLWQAVLDVLCNGAHEMNDRGLHIAASMAPGQSQLDANFAGHSNWKYGKR